MTTPLDWILGRSEPPRIDGVLHPDFLPVADMLQRVLTGQPGGAAVCVYHEGECVADLWGGVRDAAGRPWERDTMSPSFSTTKGVASTVLHVMVDRGLINYDARVAHYWPAFAQAGKADITVRQVLSHQSGLYHIRQMVDAADRMLDWDYMVHAIERAEPVHPPGEKTGYHGLTFGFLVGEIVQRVTGRPFSELVREVIAEPLGLDGLFIGAPVEQMGRAAQLMWPRLGPFANGELGVSRFSGRELADVLDTPSRVLRSALGLVGVELDLQSLLDALAPRGISHFDFNAEATLRAAIPAANGLFTARSLARMYAALAGGGTLDGVRLLSPATLMAATARQPHPAGRVVIPFDMQWRLGYHAVLTTRGIPRHGFGHYGFGGSGAWADPRRRLAVAFIVNSGMGSPFGDLRTARISGAALASVASINPRRRVMALRPPSNAARVTS